MLLPQAVRGKVPESARAPQEAEVGQRLATHRHCYADLHWVERLFPGLPDANDRANVIAAALGGSAEVKDKATYVDLGVKSLQFAQDVDDFAVAYIGTIFLEGEPQDQDPRIRDHDVPLGHELDDLLRDPRHRDAESAYCQITLTDTVRPMGAMERLRRRFPDTLVLAFDPAGAQVIPRTSAASLHQRGDLDLCCDFLTHVRAGNAASDQERALLSTAVEHSRLARAGRDEQGLAAGAGSAA